MTSQYERPSSEDSLEGGGAPQRHLRFRVFSVNTFHIPLEVTHIQIRLNQNKLALITSIIVFCITSFVSFRGLRVDFVFYL